MELFHTQLAQAVLEVLLVAVLEQKQVEQVALAEAHLLV
jgi:hypothetical protein